MSATGGRSGQAIAALALAPAPLVGTAALALLLAVAGCGDDETTEPIATGPSAVTATVDGIAWASGAPATGSDPDTSVVILEFPVNDTTRALIVRATRRAADDPDGSLLVLGFYGRFRPPQSFALDPAPSVIDLGVPPPRTLTWGVWVDDLADTASFVTDATHGGTLTFSRYDETGAILEGTFAFRAVHPITGDSVVVTAGRFVLELVPATRRPLPGRALRGFSLDLGTRARLPGHSRQLYRAVPVGVPVETRP